MGKEVHRREVRRGWRMKSKSQSGRKKHQESALL